MLHTKTKVARNMFSWEHRCKQSMQEESHCNVGFPYPKKLVGMAGTDSLKNDNGWAYNCFMNENIESYWWPKLVEAIGNRTNHLQWKVMLDAKMPY